MTAEAPPRPGPSRAHVLMRHGRSWLLARWLTLDTDAPAIYRRAVADHWTREQIAAAILTLEEEEAADDMADDV